MADSRRERPSAEPRSHEIDLVIDRIVREARLASAHERDELRQELRDHFDDAALARVSHDAALERFGDVGTVAEGLRRAHGRGGRALYGVKIVGSVVAAMCVAAVLQLLANIEVESGAVGLAPWFASAVHVSLVVVIAAVAAWELGIEPVLARLERAPATMLAVTTLVFALIYVTHAVSPSPVTAAHAFLGAASMMGVWTCALAVFTRSDAMFLRAIGGNI